MLVIHKVHLVIIMAKVYSPKNKVNMYEVGDIVLNMSGVNPGTRFGGTWELTSKGKAIIGVDPDDTDYEQAGLTMGEKEHTLTEAQIPSHSHTAQHFLVGSNAWGYTGWEADVKPGTSSAIGFRATAKVNNTGGGQPHNNIPPSMTLYVWLKIA